MDKTIGSGDGSGSDYWIRLSRGINIFNKITQGEKMELGITEAAYKELVSRFTNHTPDKATLDKMANMRRKVRELAFLIEKDCPFSKEKATALTQLSFVMMSANSAIVQACPVNEAEL